ncbi:MAG: hypothetical protein ISN29_08460 [Gammaproteobacteria bacterium AqS3]|nr:hypothetical protein [Gammaproteobacteria bacterium AqS3]
MAQEIRKIPLSELVLWSENPRDPVELPTDSQTKEKINQRIADKAFQKDSDWNMKSFCKQMSKGKEFHLNEIPTVSYLDDNPVVYDGNRRVLIGMLIHRVVMGFDAERETFENMLFPLELDCNVCDKQTALDIVNRMHADNRTWRTLQRDIFKHVHMEDEKSDFLIIDDATGIISQHRELNQLFVRDEIFTRDNLHKLGFSIREEELYHWHVNSEDAIKILESIIKIIRGKEVTTRVSRGKIIDVLEGKAGIKAILENTKANIGNSRPLKLDKDEDKVSARLTPRSRAKKPKLFGEKLALPPGDANDLYRDIIDLYDHFNKSAKYQHPAVFIRAGMRLLCETAWDNSHNVPDNNWETYIKTHFQDAKNKLTNDQKNTLSDNNVSGARKLIETLNTGAHDYTASKNMGKAVAISLILGQLLKIWANEHAE